MADWWDAMWKAAAYHAISDDPDTIRRRSEAKKQIDSYLESDFRRLGPAHPAISRELLHQAKHSYSPQAPFGSPPVSKFDPQAHNRAADTIEAVYGTLEDRMGYPNAAEYASAGAKWARSNKDLYGSFGTVPIDEAYIASKQLLPPDRFHYMQNVGRTVDLLRSLRDGSPVMSLEYYNKSRGQPLARSGLNEANYERFARWDEAARDFFQDPASAVPWYMRVANAYLPQSLKFASEHGAGADALRAAEADRQFYNRFRVGPVEVLDIPSLPDNATPEDRFRQQVDYQRRRAEVLGLQQQLAAPSWHYAANQIPYLPDVSPGVADVIGTAGEAMDISLGAGMLVGIPMRLSATSPRRILAGLTKSHGDGFAAALLAKVNEKGVAALAPEEQALMAALGRSTAGRMASAATGEAVAQGVPEFFWGAPTMAASALAGNDRTYADYWLTSSPAEEQDASENLRAVDSFESLQQHAPNDIWEARSRANPNKPPRLTGGELSPMYLH